MGLGITQSDISKSPCDVLLTSHSCQASRPRGKNVLFIVKRKIIHNCLDPKSADAACDMEWKQVAVKALKLAMQTWPTASTGISRYPLLYINLKSLSTLPNIHHSQPMERPIAAIPILKNHVFCCFSLAPLGSRQAVTITS